MSILGKVPEDVRKIVAQIDKDVPLMIGKTNRSIQAGDSVYTTDLFMLGGEIDLITTLRMLADCIKRAYAD